MRKGLLVLLLILAVTAAAGIGGGSYYLRTARPQRAGELRVPGVQGPVDIARDSLGVPHVWAASEADLLFAQGYAHAQDRLWQMELLRRAGEGRLAELFGERMLDTDRFLRVLGMRASAYRDDAALDPTMRALLDAYAAGVNAFLAGREGALPPEYLVLRARPEPWTRVHSLVIAHVMAFDLSAYGTTVALTHAAARLDSAAAAALEPFYPEWGPTILESAVPAIPPPAVAVLAASSITHASNAWVIGGARTRSGKPILANDMHLALRAPSLWYLMALHAPGIDVAGMSLPGVPYIVAGHNRAIAWGYTNAMVDDVDLFTERIDPADSTRYLAPGGSLAFERVVDTLRVARRDEPVLLRYRRTRHGPVLSDVEPDLPGAPVALRWAAHDPAASLAAVRSFNGAGDWAAFRDAVARFDNPHQNVVYADTAGHFGYAMAGRIPRRGDGTRLPPNAPVPGWTGDWDWRGYYPDSAHPAVLDPPQGYVVTANNRQAAGPMADRISTEWETPFRAARIRELVLASGRVTADDVHRMQLDVHDAHAARYRDRALAAARTAGASEEAEALAEWNLEAAADSRGAALYYVFYNRLQPRLAAALYGDTSGYLPRRFVDAALEARALPWAPARGQAGFDSVAVRAFRDAAAITAGRTWGELHRVRAEHALGEVSLLEKLLRLNLGDVPAAGSETTVNVRHFGGGAFPATSSYGPSQRHVVDMADPDGTGGFIIPTGQSGLPFEAHYRSQFERWLEGGLWRIPLHRATADARVVQRLRLLPGA